MDKITKGSQTAKAGFANEIFVKNAFNNWKNDELAQDWLKAMGYKIEEIEEVKAQTLSGYKTDVQVVILIQIYLKKYQDVQNLQVKLVSNPKGYNQVDKRWLQSYNELWNIPDDVMNILKYFVGEIPPKISNPKDSRRMFLTEFSEDEQKKIINFFEKNKTLVISDILKGRGKFASEWFLVILKNEIEEHLSWVLKSINEVINFYTGDVKISPGGSLIIGNITIQRKGGDNGRETAKMLQFKINPCLLFEL